MNSLFYKCRRTQVAEEICLENKEGCKSSRAFESFRRRGIIEKPSRGDTVLTNSLILYAPLAQRESSSLWGSNSIGRKRECKLESCLLHHKPSVRSSNLLRRTIGYGSWQFLKVPSLTLMTEVNNARNCMKIVVLLHSTRYN